MRFDDLPDPRFLNFLCDAKRSAPFRSRFFVECHERLSGFFIGELYMNDQRIRIC